MKTIEEKAKAYDEIIERAKTMFTASEVMYGKENNASQLIIDIIPELAESEDERIRKAIVRSIEEDSSVYEQEVTKEQMLAYLEKQKEQKPNPLCGSTEKYYREAYYADQPKKEQKPTEFKNNELVEIIKGEFEGFRRLLKKKGIDYEPQRGYWEAFARLFDSSAREYVKEQKPIKWTDLTWKDIVELEGIINNVHYEFRNGIGQESFGKEVLEKFREYKGDEYLDEKEQKSAEKQDYSGLNDLERAIHRGFLCAGVENVPVTIIKETAQNCLAHLPAEWSEEDKSILEALIYDIERLPMQGVLTHRPCDSYIKFLKALRPGWKPSEEQMRVLLDAINPYHLLGDGSREILNSLYEQLKKL